MEANDFQEFLDLDVDASMEKPVKIGIGVCALILFMYAFKTILGFAVMLVAGFGIGYAAEYVTPRKIPYGMVGSTVFGLLGCWLGTMILGTWGPKIGGLYIFPGVLGALLLAFIMHQKMTIDRAKALEAYQAAADDSDPHLLQLLGDYRLIGFLGKGANARVYKGVPNRSLDEGEAVAVKVLEPAAMNDEEFKGRYLREIKLCAKLEHPSIINMVDHGEQGGLSYIAMELIPGGTTLRSKIKEGGTPIIEAAGYITQLMLALDYAHSLDVIHRDIKPDNILIKGNRCKISDFGLSRGAGDASLTKTGTALGTPSYMAPEQIEGQKVRPACDQYALGVVAYELLVGEKPFTARDPMQVLFKHLHEEPPFPSDLREEVPEPLSEIVVRMMAKEEDERFESLGAAAEEVKKFMRTYKPPKN